MARGNALNHRHLELHEPSPAGYFPRQEETRGARIGRRLRAVGRRWPLIVLMTVASTAVGWLVAPPAEDLREATAVIRVGNVRPPDADEMGLPTDMVDVTAMLAQTHIVRGETLVGAVVDANSLRFWPSPDLPFYLLKDVRITAGVAATDTFSFTIQADGFQVSSGAGERSGRYGVPVTAGAVSFVLDGRPAGPASATARLLPQREAIERIAARLSAEVRVETDIMDVSYRDPDEDRALLVVNEIARAYEDYAVRAAAGVTGRSEILEIERRLAEAEAEVDRIQELLRTYGEAGTDMAPPGPSADQASVSALEAQWRRLDDQRRAYASFLSRVEGAGADRVDAEIAVLTALPAMVGNPRFDPLVSDLNARRLEHARLRASGLGETDAEVSRLARSIATARDVIVRAVADEVARIAAELASVNSRLTELYGAAGSGPVSGGEEEFLRGELGAAQSVVASVRNELQLARMGPGGPARAEILDLATFTTDVLIDDRSLVLGMSLLLGLLLGTGGALALEARDTSVRGRAELETILNVPGLAVIPRIPSAGKDAGRGSTSLKNYSPALTGTDNSMSVSPELREFHSLAAEAYRMLRTNLIYLRTDQALRSIVVTSAGMGDGKTTTAVNLAVAFARQGKKVLLVDCDLRRPRLHTFFNLLVGPGLSEVILGTETVDKVVQATPIENLSLLTRGAFDERAGEMLSGPRGRRAIQSLRERCDLLILDTSPTLLTADASAVAPYTDGVLLVARAGRTPREAARQAVAQLQVVGATVLGFVLNDPDAIGQRYGEGKYTKEYYSVEA